MEAQGELQQKGEDVEEPVPESSEFETSFKMTLPEDCVEYVVVLVEDISIKQSRSPLQQLETVRKTAMQLCDSLAKDYIWQRDEFKLDLKNQQGLFYLHGTAVYGDAIEDEWLIVYILRELTKTFKNIWARASDTGGEFLLVEAANVLPKWLSPEMDVNRVWIHDGQLRIIKPAGQTKQKARGLELKEAIQTLRADASTAVHSEAVQAEAFYRLEKYPSQIGRSQHRALATVRRKLAWVLHSRPKAIAPAVDMFYVRDARSLRPVMTAPAGGEGALEFGPADLVTVSVRFTKVLYAQLVSQRFDPAPAAWRPLLLRAAAASASVPTAAAAPDGAAAAAAAAAAVAGREDKAFARLELGMKLSVGFELLARAAEGMGSRVAREVGILLEELREEEEERGKGNGSGSVLPTDEEIAGWEDVGRDDDDGWMDIDFADFERELEGRRGKAGGPGSESVAGKDGATAGAAAGSAASAPEAAGAGFGDASVQADLRKVVSRFEAFLNDESAGLDGAEWKGEGGGGEQQDSDDDGDEEEGEDDEDDADGEDKDAGFSEAEFAQLMREMMGLPPPPGGGGSNAKDGGEEEANFSVFKQRDLRRARKALGLNSDDESGEDDGDGSEEEVGFDDDDDEEIRQLAAQFENELKGFGALQLDPGQKGQGRVKGKQVAVVGPSNRGAVQEAGDEYDSSDDDGGVNDIDYNLAKNLLESFKSQGGTAGPAGNVLGMMGLRLPRDEDDGEPGVKGKKAA